MSLIFRQTVFVKTFALSVTLVLFTGCATRYVERDVEKVEQTDSIGDVVVYKSSDEFKNNPPVCLGVLPLKASQKEFEPTQDVRKAIHAYLAPTGIALLPLQKIDANLISSKKKKIFFK